MNIDSKWIMCSSGLRPEKSLMEMEDTLGKLPQGGSFSLNKV